MGGLFNRKSSSTPPNPPTPLTASASHQAQSEACGGASGGCAPYLSPYRMAVDRLGARFESLLWNSVETQRARFRAITDVVDVSGRTVLDAGCGRADLALWLRERGVAWGRYIGVDAIPEMLEHARTLGLADAEFHGVDFIRDTNAFMCAGVCPEVIIFSGSLNTIPRKETARALERAWRTCTRGLVFNFLSAGAARRVPEAPAGSAQKLSPAGVMRWALTRTPDVVLKHDYMDGRDGTLAMFKPGARSIV